MVTVSVILILFLIFPSKVMAVQIGNLSVPSSVFSEEEFNVNFTAEDLVPGSTYYVKGLGGESFTEVDTWNSSWLQQNSAWSSMPVFTSDASGIATTSAKVRFDANTSSGNKDFKIRIRKTDGSTNYDSLLVSISVTKPTPSPSPEPTPEPTSEPTQAPTTIPTKTSTPKPAATKKPTLKPTVKSKKTQLPEFAVSNVTTNILDSTSTPEGLVAGAKTENKFPLQALGLILSGVGFMGYGGYTFYTKKKNEKIY